MNKEKVQKKYTTKVSDSFAKTDENFSYEIAFRRWLVREIEEQRMTVSEAVKQFNFCPENGRYLIRDWRKKYASDLVLSSQAMTEAEKQKLAELQKTNKALEKQLEEARMQNIAINMLIDVAEEKLNISIRKKSGAKQ
jgi:transposase-like protein